MIGFLYRVPIYLSPFFMSAMEIELNELAKTSAPSALLAPSTAAAAIGLFLPVLRPAAAAPAGWKKAVDAGSAAVALLGLLFTFYLWHMLVSVNLGNALPGWVPMWDFFGLGRSAALAILIYGFAAFLAEVKALVES